MILGKSSYAILVPGLSYSVSTKASYAFTYYIPTHDPHRRWRSGGCGRGCTRDRVDRKWSRVRGGCGRKIQESVHPVDMESDSKKSQHRATLQIAKPDMKYGTRGGNHRYSTERSVSFVDEISVWRIRNGDCCQETSLGGLRLYPDYKGYTGRDATVTNRRQTGRS